MSKPERTRGMHCLLVKMLVAIALGAWVDSPIASADPTPSTAALKIVIEGVSSNEGVVVVALLDSAEQYAAGDQMYRSNAKVPIQQGRAVVTFGDVPFGDYALKVFHDENGNGELDTNWVGFPKEGFGFSNDAMGQFGPPTFEEAAFEIKTETHEAVVNMR